jgi:putative PEP-CTERM system TPR-repeat lipoprotein
MNQNDRALDLFQRAAAQAPTDAFLRTRVGDARLAAGNIDQALSDFRAASEADPTAIAPEVAIVNFYLKQKRLDVAAVTAHEMVKKHPKEPAAQNVLGTVMMLTKDPRGARQAFEAGLAINRDFFLLVSNLTVLDLTEGKGDAAKERLKGVFDRTKSEESALLLTAVLERTGAPPKEVLDFLESATTARPNSPRLWVQRIDGFAKRGMNPQALEVAVQAEATNPGDVTILEALARMQGKNGDYVQALGSYGKLATMVPDSAAPYLGQAAVNAAANDWPRAMSAAKRAVDVAPDAIEGYHWLVKAASRAGRLDVAYATALALQKRWPADPESYLTEARLLTKEKRDADVEQVLRRGITATNGVTVVMQLIHFLEARQRGKEVETLVMDWIRKHPKNPALAIEMGDGALKSKNYAVASQWYKQALDQQPDNVLALNNRAWTLGQMRSPEALPVARKALALAPDSVQVLDTLGSLLLDAGQPAEAISVLGKAVDRAPELILTRLSLVKALVASGRVKDIAPHVEALRKLPLTPGNKAELDQLVQGNLPAAASR